LDGRILAMIVTLIVCCEEHARLHRVVHRRKPCALAALRRFLSEGTP
jgi:hypothetical protein